MSETKKLFLVKFGQCKPSAVEEDFNNVLELTSHAFEFDLMEIEIDPAKWATVRNPLYKNPDNEEN